jgi:hypothetical protein
MKRNGIGVLPAWSPDRIGLAGIDLLSALSLRQHCLQAASASRHCRCDSIASRQHRRSRHLTQGVKHCQLMDSIDTVGIVAILHTASTIVGKK